VCIPLSAFWWIAGDCLGFRRDKAVSETTGKPFALASALRYEKIISYEEQTELLCSNGFALWDIVQSCKRPGSLDSNIKDDIPNDIVGFCQHHPSIRRIVFANGKSGCDFFTKHFEEWLKIGPFVPAEDEVSKKLLGKWVGSSAMASSKPQIECVVALAVSPAAATYKYSEKRDFWEKHVYQPGLEDHDRLNAQQHS
jgi:G:T/U-mismatch repair DNA glycosylase